APPISVLTTRGARRRRPAPARTGTLGVVRLPPRGDGTAHGRPSPGGERAESELADRARAAPSVVGADYRLQPQDDRPGDRFPGAEGVPLEGRVRRLLRDGAAVRRVLASGESRPAGRRLPGGALSR